jgi:hypothetical protein
MTILWIFRRATVVKRSYEFQRASHRVSSRRLERRLGAGGRLCRAPHDPRCGWGECPGLESRGTRLLQAGFGDASRLVPRPEQRRKTRDCPLVRCGFRERMAGRALRADPGHSAAGTDALLDAVRSGRPIRLAWGGHSRHPRARSRWNTRPDPSSPRSGRSSGKEIRRLLQRAAIAWFTLGTSESACEPAAHKLAMLGGVKRAN